MPFKDFFHQLSKKDIRIIIGIAILCFLSFIVIIKFIDRPVKYACEFILREDRANALNQVDRVLAVEVGLAEMKPMTKRISTTGNLKANNFIYFKSDMPGGQGKIKKIHFEQGASVKKGDILLEFESADLKARLERAKSELKLRELEFDRIKKLFDQKIESPKKHDEAEAQLSSARAQVHEAEANLEKAIMIAPFEGVVGLISFSEGAIVQNNQELFRLVDETPMKVEFSIPERYIHDIGVGQAIEVKVDVFKGQTFKGIIEAVDSAINTETHSLSVRGSIPNDNLQLRQGLFCNLEVITGEQGDVLQVDETAIHLSQDREVVFVVEKGRAIMVPILTGYREGGKVEIRSGLRSGQIVITAGQVKFGGEKVKITNLTEDTLMLKNDTVNPDAVKDKVAEDTTAKANESESAKASLESTPADVSITEPNKSIEENKK
jgi:membrane fusion protein (multidrug efflux system)